MPGGRIQFLEKPGHGAQPPAAEAAPQDASPASPGDMDDDIPF